MEKATAAMDDEMDDLDKSIDKVDRDLAELAASAAIASAAMKGLDVQANKVDKSLATMGKNVEDVEQNVDAATKSVRTHEGQMALMRAEYEKTTARIGELNAALLNSNTAGKSGLRKSLQEQQRYLSELRRIAKEFQKATGVSFQIDGGGATSGVLEGILGGIPKMGGVPPQLVAGGVAIGLALAPPIAAAVSGAVLGTVGAGGVIGGALLASRDPEVKAAFKGLGSYVMEVLTPAGKAFKEPVLKAIAELQADIGGANLAGVIGAASPLVGPFVKGVSGFGFEITESLGTAFSRAQPLFALWEKEMPEMGDAIGDALDAVSATSAGASRGLGALFNVMEIGTRSVGAATAGLIAMNDVLSAGTMGLLDASADSDIWGTLLFGWVGTVGTAALKVQPKLSATAERMDGMSHSAEEAAAAQQRLNDAIESGTRGLELWLDIQLGIDNANIAVNRGWLELGETLKENGRHWEDNTTKGLANRQAILDQVGALERQRQQNIRNGMTLDDANAKFDAELTKLKNLAIQAGITDKALKDMIGDKYIRIHIEEITTRRNAGLGPVGALVSGFLSAFGGRAAGGPVEPGVPYTINERGRETVTFPAYGQVHPANLTPMPWNGGSSGGTVNHTFTIVVADTSGRTLRREMIDEAKGRAVTDTVIRAAFP